MKKFIYILIWLAISVVAGTAGVYFFNLNFWISSIIVGGALMLNGLIAEWEDGWRPFRPDPKSKNRSGDTE